MKKEITVGIIFLAALTLQLASLPPESSLTYDGALYIDIGRSLSHNPTSFTYQGIYMMYRPPLYPYTLSLLYRFIHSPSAQLLAARLVSVIAFALTAVVVYLLASEILGEVGGVISSAFFILNPLAYTMASRELVHSEFTLFYTLAVYLLYTGRKRGNPWRIYLAFLLAGLAILTRYTGLSIIAVFFAYLWLVEDWKWVWKKEYWVGLTILLITLLPWLYMGHVHYRGAFRPFSVASRVVTLDRPVSVSDYLNLLLKDVGKVLPALAALGFLRLKKDDGGWLLVSWLSLGLAGILAVTHKETRFLTFLSPVVAILAAEGVLLMTEAVWSLFNPRKFHEAWKTAFIVLLAILLLVPVASSAHNLHERWNLQGKVYTEVLSYSAGHYPAERLLVPPRMYTMAGFYYPDSRVEMAVGSPRVKEKVREGYYDVIILSRPWPNIGLKGSSYVKVKEFHGGKFVLYLQKGTGES